MIFLSFQVLLFSEQIQFFNNQKQKQNKNSQKIKKIIINFQKTANSSIIFFFLFINNFIMKNVVRIKRNSLKAKTFVLKKPQNQSPRKKYVRHSITSVSLKGSLQNEKQKIERAKEYSNTKEQQKLVNNSKNEKINIVFKNRVREDEKKLTIKKTCSFYSTTSSAYSSEEIVGKLLRNKEIYLQNEKIFTSMESFKEIISNYLSQNEELKAENFQLLTQNRKYETFLREFKIDENQRKDENKEQNLQLKVLNLEKKIQTLNYIIKQYRSNNKEEIKMFQKKILQYKPSLEHELKFMLSEANKRNLQLESIIKTFGEQCKSNDLHDLKELAKNNMKKTEQIKILNEKFSNAEGQLEEIKKKYENTKKIVFQINDLNLRNIQLKFKIDQKQGDLSRIKNQYNSTKKENIEIKELLEEALEKIQILEEQNFQRKESMKKNTIVIHRLQNENYCLKAKMEAINENQLKQICPQAEQFIERLSKRNSLIEELSTRFLEEAQKFPLQHDENISFILHLFSKIKDLLEITISEFRHELVGKVLQIKNNKIIAENLFNENQKRFSELRKIQENLQLIDEKKNRCTEPQLKLEKEPQHISSCLNWIVHWGQLENLYEQIRNLITKTIQIME